MSIMDIITRRGIFGHPAGRTTLDSLLGFLTLLVLIPPMVSAVLLLANSFLQFLTSIVATALPWLGLVALVAVAGAVLAACGLARPRTHYLDEPAALSPIPPVVRPPGLPRRRQDY
jgi:hypothetical protein